MNRNLLSKKEFKNNNKKMIMVKIIINIKQ